jgi:hypothetical protein
MANNIQHKRSSVAGKIPTSANLAVGEIAINFSDKLIYTKNTSGNVIVIAYGSLESYTGNIIPSQNVTYSLGNATHRFSNLYLSGSTIDLSGGQIKYESGRFKFLDFTGNPSNTLIYTANIIESGTASSGNVFYSDARAYSNTLSAIKTGNGIAYNNLTGNITLSATGVIPGSYGNATFTPQIQVDSFGRITSISNISTTGSGVNGFTSNANSFIISTTSGNLYANLNIDAQLGLDLVNDYANNKVVLAVQAGLQGLTVDYGLVTEVTSAITYDYGTL